MQNPFYSPVSATEISKHQISFFFFFSDFRERSKTVKTNFFQNITHLVLSLKCKTM